MSKNTDQKWLHELLNGKKLEMEYRTAKMLLGVLQLIYSLEFLVPAIRY